MSGKSARESRCCTLKTEHRFLQVQAFKNIELPCPFDFLITITLFILSLAEDAESCHSHSGPICPRSGTKETADEERCVPVPGTISSSFEATVTDFPCCHGTFSVSSVIRIWDETLFDVVAVVFMEELQQRGLSVYCAE
jgi:hypothetical protein